MTAIGTAGEQFLVRLKTQTRAEHEALEASIDLLGSGLSLGRYRGTIRALYGFYEPLEAGIYATGDWTARGVEPGDRRRAEALAADLRALGIASPTEMPVCGDLPPHGTPASSFGCLYVLEGATLGGQIISRHIRSALGVTPETGGRFFQGYGERTGAMWRSFRAALTDFARTRAVQDEVIGAASGTFRALHRWIAKMDSTHD